ncbi:MAG TPA: ATP-binding protein [Gemmatimonadaceae bacterium]
MARWPSTLRWRLTLWYSALLGAPLIALAIGYYLFFARTLYSRTDQFIGDALVAFSRELVAERRVATGVISAIHSTVDEVRFRDLHIAVLDSAGAVVAMTPLAESGANADRRPAVGFDDWIGVALRQRDLAREQTLTIGGPRGPYRVSSRPLVLAGQRFAVTGTYSLAEIAGVLERIRRMFVLVVPLLIICAATGGYFLAVRSLAPIASMAARAAEISATNLRDRLPVSGGEELAGLARVVNDLLARLEASFSQQRRFMADASHELRTPTAILRSEADVTLAQEHRSEQQYRAAVTVMRDAARRLTRIVDDLFLLARADSGNLVARRESIYLEELVHDATRAVRPLADQRAIRVELREVVEAPFDGDADLLGRLLLNLLDNAIKHSPDGGAVEVGVSRRDGRYEIDVIDAGQGIPAEARERIFERFVRLDAARARSEQSSTSGAGLGLAIARRIAEAHGGRLELVDSRPGHTEFRVTLPALSESPTVAV